MSPWTKVKLLVLTSHIVAFVGTILYWNLPLFLLSIAFGYFIYLFGCSIGAHRIWAHRSLNTYPVVKYGTAVLTNLMGMGSVVAFVSQHRQHHKYSDLSKELDPYWSHDDYSFWGTAKAYAQIPRQTPIELNMIKDLLRDKYVWFLHEHYFASIAIWIGLLALINPILIIYGFCIPSVISYLCSQVPGVWGHRVGVVNHLGTDDRSKDSHWLNIFSLGEAYQNTHHKYPTRVIMGKYDIAGIIAEKFLRKK